ncbi:MAG: HD-GYP domain-containing protein [Actinomycetota bacterium]|jgi:putative nucleotidyltransferase with HDIG domain|nr:HD-GYP domain-containing protein [Actinomycetota bacterium]
MNDRSHIVKAFSSSRWSEITEAFLGATGLSVSVSTTTGDCISRSTHCSLCGLVSDGVSVGECNCLDDETIVHLGDSPIRVTCRGGLSVYGTALREDVQIVVGGFFSSTRERKRAFQSLVGRGLGDDEARIAVRDVPPVAHKQVQAYASMISLQALAALESNKVASATDPSAVATVAPDSHVGELDGAAAEAVRLGEFARATGVAGDIPSLEPIVLDALSRSFPNALAGLLLSGWGSDRAAFTTTDGTGDTDVALVVLEATGRDMITSPFDSMTRASAAGRIAPDATSDEWTTLTAEIFVQDKVAGYLLVASRDGSRYSADDRRLLQDFADHTAITFERASVFERLHSDYSRALAALSVTLDASEGASRGHSDRVMDYAMLIGREVGLPAEQIEMLRFAGLLHDIGKTGIAEEILLKPTSLTDEEAARVRSHAERGATLVEQVDFLNGLAPIIMHHHERWDGTGYPMRLRGDDTPIMARILGVADAYDSMTSERPYRPRLSHSAARDEMEAAAGTQFDPLLVAAIFEALDRRALGGSTGVLRQYQPGYGSTLLA